MSIVKMFVINIFPDSQHYLYLEIFCLCIKSSGNLLIRNSVIVKDNSGILTLKIGWLLFCS